VKFVTYLKAGGVVEFHHEGMLGDGAGRLHPHHPLPRLGLLA